MSEHPCCIRVIPYESEGDSNKCITMCLYVSANDMGIPDKVGDAAKKMFVNYGIKVVDLQKRPPGKILKPLLSSEKRRDEELSALSRKIEENIHLFDKRLNVTAVQASYKVIGSEELDIPCVAVFVLGKNKFPAGETDIKKIKDDNDPLFKDVEFDVLEGYYQPTIDALQACHVSPLQSGFGIGVEGTDGAGTLGGFLEDEDGKHYILSCQHVLHPRGAHISHDILQPAMCDFIEMKEEAVEELDKVLNTGVEGLRLTQEDRDILRTNYPRKMRNIEKREREAREKLEEIESKKPRAIGTYVGGLQKNVEIERVQFFVDAAIAVLHEEEEDDLTSMSQLYCGLYGYEKRKNVSKPNGDFVELKDLDKLSTDYSELRFHKSGRTTGLTKDAFIDQSDKELFVNTYNFNTPTYNFNSPTDPPITPICHVPYYLCKDCKFLDDDQEKEIDCNQKMTEYKCVKCKKEIDQVSPFWARNCLVIRNHCGNAFCSHGDSGSLVFDEDGKAWGLLHGVFIDLSRNYLFGLASPLCVTLKALEDQFEIKLKLWRV